MHRLNVKKIGMFFPFVLVTVLCVVFGCTFTQKIHYRLKEGYIIEPKEKSICEVCDSSTVVVLSQNSGLWIGKELDVYAVKTITRIKQAPLYEKVYKGRIKITEIIDDYHSKAIVVSGQVRMKYRVELYIGGHSVATSPTPIVDVAITLKERGQTKIVGRIEEED